MDRFVATVFEIRLAKAIVDHAREIRERRSRDLQLEREDKRTFDEHDYDAANAYNRGMKEALRLFMANDRAHLRVCDNCGGGLGCEECKGTGLAPVAAPGIQKDGPL